MPELVVAAAGKGCYSSGTAADILEDITPEQAAKFIRQIKRSGHTSVLEHASFTFGVDGVSRSLLAQITRHRIASFSVQSQRYVNMAKPEFVMPEFKRELFFKKAGENDRIKTRVRGKDGFQVGKEALDLRYVEQIVDVEQTAALAAMLRYTMEHINGSKRISEIVETLEKEISSGGLEAVVGGDFVRCGLAMPRKQEIFACLNRYRG